MDISQKEESLLVLFEGLSKAQERVLRMYFGLGGIHKKTLEEMGQDLDLRVDDVLQIKNEGIREFIKLIVSTGILGDKYKSFSDEFIESSDTELLDKFMMKFIA
jgi:DNA-directed RNA polymerase sigma subunit (sigma70/sigma32)